MVLHYPPLDLSVRGIGTKKWSPISALSLARLLTPRRDLHLKLKREQYYHGCSARHSAAATQLGRLKPLSSSR